LKLVAKRLVFDIGQHFYMEASGAWEGLMKRWNAPRVPFEDAQKVLQGKKLEPVPGDPFAYRRMLGGTMRQKMMFGNPVVPQSKPFWKRWISSNLEEWLG
jgi:hypothetical protein